MRMQIVRVPPARRSECLYWRHYLQRYLQTDRRTDELIGRTGRKCERYVCMYMVKIFHTKQIRFTKATTLTAVSKDGALFYLT